MGENDKSVGKYLIRTGRRVSRLGEGWKRGKARGPTIGKQDCWWSTAAAGGARAGGDAKVPFEDSYFPRSHRCHTSPAILRLSLHCGNHNYTCGCLLIAPPPPRRGSLRGEKEGEKEGGRESLVFSSVSASSPLYSSPPSTFSPTSKLDRSFPSRFSNGILKSERPFREKRSDVARISKGKKFESEIRWIIFGYGFFLLVSKKEGFDKDFFSKVTFKSNFR